MMLDISLIAPFCHPTQNITERKEEIEEGEWQRSRSEAG